MVKIIIQISCGINYGLDFSGILYCDTHDVYEKIIDNLRISKLSLFNSNNE